MARARGLAVVAVLLGSAMFVQSAGADGIGSQQQQVKNDLAQIDRLNQKASQLNEDYLGYVNQKAELDAEIAVSQQKISSQQAVLVSLQGQLANLAVEKFTGGSSDSLGPLFSDPGNLSDGLQRDQLAKVAVNAGAATTDGYNTLLAQLNQEQADLQAKQAKAAKLAKAATDASQQATAAGQAYQDELAKDQAKLGDLLAQEQQRELDAAAAQHAKDVAAAQAKAKAKADANAIKANLAASNNNILVTGPDNAGSGNNGSGNASSSGSSSGDIPAAQTSKGGSSSSGSSSSGSSGGSSSTSDASASTSTSGSSDSGSGSSASDTSSTTPDPPPVSSRAELAVAAARSQLGVPYKFAMSSPGVAFDCSGLTAYAWKMAGVSIVHQSAQQYATTPHVAITDIQPGDLLFFYHPISHVTIYIGNGQEIQAPAPGKFVEISQVDWKGLVGASRPG